MLQRPRNAKRSGAAVVEAAIAMSVAFIVVLSLLIGGTGVFRYQQMAHLAREGARYAATHGGKYAEDGHAKNTGQPAIAASTDLRPVLLAKATALDPQRLKVAVSYRATGKFKPANYPYFVDTDPNLVPPGQKVVDNYVTVTVIYQWSPELYVAGPITLTSTSTLPVSY
jgi:Flp pilus assembly protein TadG